MEINERFTIMSAIGDFIKEIFFMKQQTGLIGLSGIKKMHKNVPPKTIRPMKKKESEPKLSEIMRRSHKQLEV